MDAIVYHTERGYPNTMFRHYNEIYAPDKNVLLFHITNSFAEGKEQNDSAEGFHIWDFRK